MSRTVSFKIGERIIIIKKPERCSKICHPFPDNFGIVIAGKLYRGAFPKREELAVLKKLGVKRIITLYSACELNRLEGLIAIVNEQNIEHSIFEITGPASFKRVARYIFENEQPLYVHCEAGSNRTGKVIALVRIYLGQIDIESILVEVLRYGFSYDKEYRSILECLLTEA